MLYYIHKIYIYIVIIGTSNYVPKLTPNHSSNTHDNEWLGMLIKINDMDYHANCYTNFGVSIDADT